MIFRPDAGGLLFIKRTGTLENFRQVLFRPNLLARVNLFGTFQTGKGGPLACSTCWLEAHLLTQVRK